MADEQRDLTAEQQAQPGAEDPEKDKTEYKFLTEDLKEEINDIFDIFDKDKDG